MLPSIHTHVLVIDDAPEDLSAVAALMRDKNWRVSIATNGRQGFHRAQALQPDLILLDVFIPGMDGLALCRLLQESPRTRDTPVIFVSNAGSPEDRVAGFRQGAVDYVVKPIRAAEVLARICVHLTRSVTPRVVASSGPMPMLSQGETTLRAAMRLINANLAELPPLSEVARQVGTHDKKLSTIFREHLGMTVFAWVRDQRLRVAREWLADSEMSVADIATQVGFHSAANFATAFRKRMGVTPSQYRKNMQQTGVDTATLVNAE